MPFQHLDQGTLAAARRTILREAELRANPPLLLQEPAPQAPQGIALLAIGIIRCWAIRAALRERFAIPGSLPESAPAVRLRTQTPGASASSPARAVRRTLS